MSSYFTVEFDTTSPIIDVAVTKLVQQGHSIELEISSNEDLSIDQDIYITDYKNRKQLIILERVNPRLLSGFISTEDYAEGPASLHIQLWDEVANTVVYNAPILIITDGLTYCMHDVVKYVAPFISDRTIQPTVERQYTEPLVSVLKNNPSIELVGHQPTESIKYVAPKCTVRRCHNI